ncbi:DNA/RNA helicase domain-containing protein [uncultured Paraglaciecola sp.]|uniref:DNA/RNA helicase domain-containing protein n=1 Tax=uncultured Paraglaciecola sp. TaxID=1765024 RepID=UPI0026197B97|nr:DNA/RNA helicase domain-containing protein [uncultured Paraglaciecola sp.]
MMVSQNKHLDLSNHYHHASINQSQAYLCRFSKGYEGDQFHFSRNESIALLPCAYLHNMKVRDAINDDFYAEHIKKAPVFISPYVLKHTMYRIEHGKIKPSKNLADALASMLDGNPEFLMIDEQKLVYETALDLAQQGHKQTLIVKGGPGTGKKTHIDTPENNFGALLVDEAHRLNEKSGLYGNLGENQIKELINASRFNVFFIDEAQRVTLKDIGSIQTIHQWADKCQSTVTQLDLVSQFRCNGSDGYLAWIDNSLQIRPTAHLGLKSTLEDIDYDVKVFDDPNELRKAIFEKNRVNNKARMVAGYCWEWASKKDKTAMDIIIPEFNFEAQWNLTDDGSLWLIAEKSVEQIGCIHTCQGLELDYIGVIIGNDFVIRDGEVVIQPLEHPGRDKALSSTYRTLMTRGQKGCFIYCTDQETREHFQKITSRQLEQEASNELDSAGLYGGAYKGLDLPVVSFEQAKPYQGYVPIFDLEVAAQNNEWVQLPDHINTTEGMFVTRVVGESMNRRIINGSWCLFKANPGGSRNGKIVLVQHRDIEDPDHGGTYTVKMYHSEKIEEDGVLVNQRIVLKPETNAYGYSPIVIEDGGGIGSSGEIFIIVKPL